jgi:hypothetical protein
MKIAKWNLSEEVQIRRLNLGIHEPQLVKLNGDLDSYIINVGEKLFKEYKYIFAWTHKDLKGIPLHLVQH